MTNAVRSFLEGSNDEHTFRAAVKTVVYNMFGVDQPPFNVDAVSYLAAAIDSSLYAQQKMRGRPRFGGRDDLLRFAVTQVTIKGLYLEFGVASGRTVNLLAEHCGGARIFGFDSFKGLPEDWTEGVKRGMFAVDGLPTVHRNVELIIGLFENSLDPFLAKYPGDVAFIHVDCDLYSSTKTVFDCLQERIVPGTVIVFDEYFNYPEWRGHEYLAFQEFIARYKIEYEYIGLVPSYEQVAVRVTARRRSGRRWFRGR